MDKKQNLQDTFLNAVRKAKTPLTIFLVNGVKLQGVVTWFDNFCVLLRRDGQVQLVNHLGVKLGNDAETILDRLDQRSYGDADIDEAPDRLASDHDYDRHVRDIDAETAEQRLHLRLRREHAGHAVDRRPPDDLGATVPHRARELGEVLDAQLVGRRLRTPEREPRSDRERPVTRAVHADAIPAATSLAISSATRSGGL